MNSNLGAMDGLVAFAHCRLVEWAKWCRDQPAWPTRTVLGRLAEEGPGASSGGLPGPTAIPSSVVLCDFVISQLSRKQQRVIKAYYLIGKPDDTSARKLRMPKHRYRYILRQARLKIASEIQKQE